MVVVLNPKIFLSATKKHKWSGTRSTGLTLSFQLQDGYADRFLAQFSFADV